MQKGHQSAERKKECTVPFDPFDGSRMDVLNGAVTDFGTETKTMELFGPLNPKNQSMEEPPGDWGVEAFEF